MQQWLKDFETFCLLYNSLSAFIRNLPIAPHLQKLIQDEFDTGYLWVKESLTVIMPNLVKPEDQANPANPITPNANEPKPEEKPDNVE